MSPAVAEGALAVALTQALEQQRATSEILKAIALSTADIQPVFDTIAVNAARLCGAQFCHVFRFDGRLLHFVAYHRLEVEGVEAVKQFFPSAPRRDTAAGRSILSRSIEQIAAVDDDPEYGPYATITGGYRSLIGVPMLREDVPVGSIVVARSQAGPFPERQVELLRTFADQAVIAIENARLLDELAHRNRDLSVALEQQIASSEILRAIAASPTDFDPVLKAVAESAARLCGAIDATILLHEGDLLAVAAHHGEIPIDVPGFPIVREIVSGRAFIDGVPVHVHDLTAAGDDFPQGREYALRFGFRSIVSTPLLREGRAIGAIMIRRAEVRPFSATEIELLKTFADQAVIAIQNARLFEEVRAKTSDLTEALEQQTATAEILGVISNSLSDTQPVFDAIVRGGVRLFPGSAVSIALAENDRIEVKALAEEDASRAEAWRSVFPFPLAREYMHGAAILDNAVVDIPDVERAPPQFEIGSRNFLKSGYRAVTIMPLVRADQGAIGALSVVRRSTGPVSAKQLEILRTFAKQAVIAIENTRLLRELRETLQQQTATAEVLKAISRSAFDLETVLQTLVQSAVQLCDAEKGIVTRPIDGVFYRAEAYGHSAEFMEYVRNRPVTADRGSITGRALFERRTVHVADVDADPDYTFSAARRVDVFRTILAVPMMREDEPLGVLALTRSDVRPFTERQIELASTFADQAAIAIENVHLFEELRDRTEELAASLDDLRTAQDRLVQTEKLASLGQLTAGIAHEIKNPLNFVNNFAALSTELLEELRAALAGAGLGDAVRADVEQLVQMLEGNLGRIVEHGRRADSIVKNMLLHSRSGSGERRPVDVNALVEESLNLAYHGARAERPGFNIRLEKALDPAAGQADVYPQEITRVLLNIISNGFYAASKKKEATGGGDFEPSLSAATRNLGDRIEIRIRDNGTGVSAQVRERMFDPFFTTKPAGEGTGLGLSLSYDIVVKQHMGSIEVDSEPGAFTEFRIVLPRGVPHDNSGGGRDAAHPGR